MRLVLNSLHDEVAAKLRERIFSGALAPGSLIDEPGLCSEWAISRTPLREALKVLTAEGLLRHEPRRGCFVSEITERDLDEIFPVIALLEGRCAFEAANNATDADLAALEQLHDRLQRSAELRIAEVYRRIAAGQKSGAVWQIYMRIYEILWRLDRGWRRQG